MQQSNGSQEDVTFLRSIASSEASDALVSLGHPHGGYLQGLAKASPLPGRSGRSSQDSNTVCGPIIPVKLVPASDKTSSSYEGTYADAAEPGKVMFISQPRGATNAVWGGLMSARAFALGVLGVVVDGQIRDVAEQRDSGFWVFSRGTSPLPAKGHTRCTGVNVAVEFESDLGTIVIRPGDYLIADDDGAVVIPVQLIPEVVQTARKSVAGDVQAMEAIKNGTSANEAFKKFRGR